MNALNDDDALLDLVCMTMISGVGPHTSRALLERFGTPSAVLDARESTLTGVDGVGPKLAERIARGRQDHNAAGEIALCRQCNVSLVPRSHPQYPERLAEIHDPPPLLYVKGTLEPRDALAIALVGSRKCTPYGVRTAERLAHSLARVGLTVISGLARGIDAAAHRGAIKAGGRTLAVLANGLENVYPPEHDRLADEVAGSGALVCEMPMRQKPLAGLFPQRNRIISGLCLGVVVVEATPRSGSLATAHHAMEQGREVFAVPGPVDSLASRGCHRLIRDGAKLVENVEDILEEIGSLTGKLSAGPDEAPARVTTKLPLTAQEQSILDQVEDMPVAVDELVARTRLTASQVLATLSILEMRRLIRRVPGNQFVRP
jgi:DNA processing protein